MNSTLNTQIQTGRSKKKQGRPEKATLPKYNSHQVDFLHFMASTEGYMRGIKFEHLHVKMAIARVTRCKCLCTVYRQDSNTKLQEENLKD